MKKIILPLVILGVGVGIAGGLIATGPELVPRPAEVVAPLVNTLIVQPETVQMTTRAHGTVAPRTESELVPEVSGRVFEVSDALVSGGFFKKGDVLVQIETLDYEVALEQAKAGLARAESDVANARKGHERQLDLATKQSTSASQRDDALNRLLVAEAGLREANARLARAERDLARTQLVAPFDRRVRSERVDVGQFVNRGGSIATLYAIDFAEVRLPIHDDELAFLDLSLNRGEKVSVEVRLAAEFAGARHEWIGEIVRTEGEIDGI